MPFNLIVLDFLLSVCDFLNNSSKDCMDMKTISSISDAKKHISSGDMQLLYISRPGCNVCKSLLPKVEVMLKGFREINGGYINLDILPELPGLFSVFTIPAVLLYIRGKEAIREARYISLEDLRRRIERYCSLLFS